MSTFSLPRLINGGGFSKNCVVNRKFASFKKKIGKNNCTNNDVKTVVEVGNSAGLNQVNGNCFDQNNTATMRRNPINRQGSIMKHNFRGVKKQYLESQTNLIIHSMTVRISNNN